ncbi:hypothetical protein C492_15861 [Natronococcus jeotgali DSM 18795]|uniref:Uncharacterized protein n=1 Tax=Natronococcus jeotgali DSM 18795 TaxID=1227498 RepID=L9X067_9EURY|nr:hypothetical protein C492_15861 [Natronococcus jeotgali DSM 18795]
MPNAAIVVLAGTESASDLGRVVNGLQTATEFDDAGDDVEIIFDVRKSLRDFRANQNA